MATSKSSKSGEGESIDLENREPETVAEREAPMEEVDQVEAAQGTGSIYEAHELMDPDKPFTAENPLKRALVGSGRDENFQQAADAAGKTDEGKK